MRVRRILASVATTVLVAGIGVAAAVPASAADLGGFTANCTSGGRVDQTISGVIGDTFTVTTAKGSSVCFAAENPGGFVSSSLSSGTSGDTTTVTLVASGSTVFRWEANGNGIYFAVTAAVAEVPAVASAPIPAWVKAYGRFGKDAACDTGWNPSWQKWAEPVTGGWVCTRTIPSLG